MNSKWIQGIAMAALSVAALVFLIMGNLEITVLFMTLLFVLTNSFRYRQMKAQGMDREAKWMRGMAIIFAVLFVIVLITVIV
ncbi:hypothetical protein BN1080_03020 [Planococcus massiliensis]|uniref:Uncharacterized protein n=1 Tax=Planococcus massiliensis TaxID=1499687 RepID=A0A098EQC5_9BACL|nr:MULTISPECIES: hypothetical protein [Planococcus]MCJ1909440.1 hypothetical protein [Planococcus ruber]CEG24002.1 hypothetical protein BN1080_03020 [Planococcus massiliensis]